MRVLHLIHQYPPDQIGGSELYTHHLATALLNRGFETAIFTRRNRNGRGWAREQVGNVPVYSAWAGDMSPAQRYQASFRNRSLVASFKEVLNHFKPEMIHVQHLMGLPLEVMEIVSEQRIPYLISFHDYWWICSNANRITNYSGKPCDGPFAQVNCSRCVIARGGGEMAWLAFPAVWGMQQWRAAQLRRIVQRAAMLLAPSNFVRNWYLQHGIRAEAIHTLPLGVETPPVLPERKEQQARPLRLLYLGGIASIKGVHVIVEAVQAAEGKVELLIAGDLSAEPEYAATLRKLAHANVQFLGKLSRSEVWSALANTDALLVPSLNHETYCFSAREAQSVGTPVIASKMGALSEIVQHGKNGLLLPAADSIAWQNAIQNLVEHPEQLTHFRLHAAHSFTIDEHVERLITYYADIASHHKRELPNNMR